MTTRGYLEDARGKRWQLHKTRVCPVCGAPLMLGDPVSGTWHCSALSADCPEFIGHYRASVAQGTEEALMDSTRSQTTTTKPWDFEICRDCGTPNIAAFRTTDAMWKRVTGLKAGILCIVCFDRRATAKGINWLEDPIEFHPVSTIANRNWRAVEETGPHRVKP